MNKILILTPLALGGPEGKSNVPQFHLDYGNKVSSWALAHSKKIWPVACCAVEAVVEDDIQKVIASDPNYCIISDDSSSVDAYLQKMNATEATPISQDVVDKVYTKSLLDNLAVLSSKTL